MIQITTQMLSDVIADLKHKRLTTTNTSQFSQAISNGPDATTRALMGQPQESPSEIERLNHALSVLSSDVYRGSGSFYDSNGEAEGDYWLAVIWSIASLNWSCGKDIAKTWSKKSSRYTDNGFENAWKSYNPLHPNAIGIGSLYKRASESNCQLSISHPTVPNSDIPRFTLLGIDDLAALSPTEHLVKGILPSTGLGAIYGPSGSGKTFLALDLMMAVACQTDWFGHKVKNAPVVYVGLEGKGGINKRIQAWRNKNPNLNPSNFKIILNNFDLRKQSHIEALAQTIINDQMHQGLIVIDTLNQASPGADENSSTDMGIIIKHLKLLQEMTSGLVLIVHHTGKNTAQGLRGHSSLKAALDANIEVTGGDKKSWLLEKSKDGEDGKSFGFRLEVQELGIDSDGETLTSCTVGRDHILILTKAEPSGKLQKQALKIIKQALTNSPDQRLNVEDGVTAIAKSLTTIASNKRNNQARKLLGDLVTGDFLGSELIDDVGWVWLP